MSDEPEKGVSFKGVFAAADCWIITLRPIPRVARDIASLSLWLPEPLMALMIPLMTLIHHPRPHLRADAEEGISDIRAYQWHQ